MSLSCAGSETERPNIVLIIADDQAFTDFGFMGDQIVRTPHIDRLAAESARFTHAYVPTAMCRPSLATLLTGRYPHESGIYFNLAPGNQQAAVERAFRSLDTLPDLLARKGYSSLQTGKFWEGHHENGGFTHGMTIGETTALADHETLHAFVGPFGDHGLKIGREGLQPIFEFIEERGNEPFFVWFAPLIPHVPFTPPDEFAAVYDDLGLDPRIAAYYAMCSWLDAKVGELLDYLDRKDLAKRTLVVFLSDNGFRPNLQSNQPFHSRRSKASPFELGVRTPILVRWPGHTRAATHVEPVSSVDLVPTFLEAAGLGELPLDLPGISLLASAEGRGGVQREAVFGEDYRYPATGVGDPAADLLHRWVRRGPWKLIEPTAPDSPPMLFRVAEDPLEQNDLAADTEWAPERAELEALLDAWWQPVAVRSPSADSAGRSATREPGTFAGARGP